MRHLQQCQESNRLDLQVLLQRNACQLDLKSFKVLESFSYKAKIAEYVRSYVVYFFSIRVWILWIFYYVVYEFVWAGCSASYFWGKHKAISELGSMIIYLITKSHMFFSTYQKITF